MKEQVAGTNDFVEKPFRFVLLYTLPSSPRDLGSEFVKKVFESFGSNAVKINDQSTIGIHGDMLSEIQTIISSICNNLNLVKCNDDYFVELLFSASLVNRLNPDYIIIKRLWPK